MKKIRSLYALVLMLPLMSHSVITLAQTSDDIRRMEQQDSSTQSGSDQQQPYPEQDTQDDGSTGTSDEMGAPLDDSTVTNRVRSALSQESSLKFAHINVETRNGIVYLTGTVNSAAEAKKAVEVVQGIDGVQAVKQDLKTKR